MLTKLEAVNIVLNSIGETPVSSLASGLPDAEEAEAKLNMTALEVLSKGWHQNLERGLVLSRQASGEIIIPNHYLRVDTVEEDKHINVIVREQAGRRKLFDAINHKFKFDKDLKCDVIVSIDYEGLTFELQNYIAQRAARKFQESVMGSAQLDNFAVRQEGEAYAALLDSESETEDNNILRDSPHVAYATHRNHAYSGR
jgi:hypothetical protein